MNVTNKLRSIPIFEHLDDAALEQLSRDVELRAFQRQAVIFKQDEPGEEMFVIAEGNVQIVRVEKDEMDYLRPQGNEKELCRLGPGDYFGELALLGGERRYASAHTLTSAKTWVLRRERFQSLILQSPQMALEICRGLASYLHRTTAQPLELRRLC